MEEYKNPYCPVCDSCGEDGCCSALSCKQDPNGDYCETYLKELKFAYSMYKFLMDLVSEDPKYKDEIDEKWDSEWDKFFDKDNKIE